MALSAESKAGLELANLLVKHEAEKKAAMDTFKSAKQDHASRAAESNRRNGIFVGISAKIAAKEKLVEKKQCYQKKLEEKLKPAV